MGCFSVLAAALVPLYHDSKSGCSGSGHSNTLYNALVYMNASSFSILQRDHYSLQPKGKPSGARLLKIRLADGVRELPRETSCHRAGIRRSIDLPRTEG